MMPQPALQWPMVRPGRYCEPEFDPCGAGPIQPQPEEAEPDEGEGDAGLFGNVIASLTPEEAAELAPSLRKSVTP